VRLYSRWRKIQESSGRSSAVSESAPGQPRKRPWLAAALAAVVPGLGHAYARLWRRGLLWFAVYLLPTQFLVPADAVPESVSIEAFTEAARAMPLPLTALIVGISVLNVLDAYLSTARQNETTDPDGTGQTCPHCGRDLDGDLDFCHWCTTRLDDAGSDAEATTHTGPDHE
jgi:hypothetical protein